MINWRPIGRLARDIRMDDPRSEMLVPGRLKSLRAKGLVGSAKRRMGGHVWHITDEGRKALGR